VSILPHDVQVVTILPFSQARLVEVVT